VGIVVSVADPVRALWGTAVFFRPKAWNRLLLAFSLCAPASAPMCSGGLLLFSAALLLFALPWVFCMMLMLAICYKYRRERDLGLLLFLLRILKLVGKQSPFKTTVYVMLASFSFDY
jgi:hypothetical protein